MYKKIKCPDTSRAYKREEIEIAFMYAPNIYPCCHCGHPVAEGYCCLTCDSVSPNDPECKDKRTG